jgi:iron only hydrogenase large subunit-like protein
MSAPFRISGLEDLTSTSAECIIPIEPAQPSGTVQLRDLQESAADRARQRREGVKTAPCDADDHKAIRITLNDCLACTGCITSAETVLLEEQGVHRLAETIAAAPEGAPIVVSLEPVAVASVAARLSIPVADAAGRLSRAFRAAGATHVISTAAGLVLSRFLFAEEAVEAATADDGQARPLLASVCPGFVCFAEKSSRSAIPYLSRAPSPMTATGALLASWKAAAHPEAPPLLHISVQPCFDRKLEAVRPETQLRTAADGTTIATTHLVVSAGECVQQFGDSLLEAAVAPIEEVPLPDSFQTPFTTTDGLQGLPFGAGGYCEAAAARLAPDQPVVWRVGRNKDISTVTILLPSGQPYRMARVYGFRNIQNLARHLERGNKVYDCVEVMACGRACVAGAGQAPPVSRAAAAARTDALPAASFVPAAFLDETERALVDGVAPAPRLVIDGESVSQAMARLVSLDPGFSTHYTGERQLDDPMAGGGVTGIAVGDLRDF